eukprot:206628-Chlamydomonas_euryale.AAC.5
MGKLSGRNPVHQRLCNLRAPTSVVRTPTMTVEMENVTSVVPSATCAGRCAVRHATAIAEPIDERKMRPTSCT